MKDTRLAAVAVPPHAPVPDSFCPMSLLAAIDQGTTGTRCYLFDLAGRVVASAYREHAQSFPRPGWVEHDASRDPGQRGSRRRRGGRGRAPRARARARRDEPARDRPSSGTRAPAILIAPAIVWQDTRTDTDCRALIAGGCEPDVRARTGLPSARTFGDEDPLAPRRTCRRRRPSPRRAISGSAPWIPG